MKNLITTAVAVLTVAGCASAPNEPPNTNLHVDKEITAMTRPEVISAVTECENAGMNALVLYGKRKINGSPSHVVVDVTCVPAPRRFR